MYIGAKAKSAGQLYHLSMCLQGTSVATHPNVSSWYRGKFSMAIEARYVKPGSGLDLLMIFESSNTTRLMKLHPAFFALNKFMVEARFRGYLERSILTVLYSFGSGRHNVLLSTKVRARSSRFESKLEVLDVSFAKKVFAKAYKVKDSFDRVVDFVLGLSIDAIVPEEIYKSRASAWRRRQKYERCELIKASLHSLLIFAHGGERIGERGRGNKFIIE